MRVWPKLARFGHSLRFRLTLWYAAILALVLVVFSGLLYSIEAKNLQDVTDSELHNSLQQYMQYVPAKNGDFTFPKPGIADKLVQLGGFLLLIDSQTGIAQPFGILNETDIAHLRNTITIGNDACSDYTLAAPPATTGTGTPYPTNATEFRLLPGNQTPITGANNNYRMCWSSLLLNKTAPRYGTMIIGMQRRDSQTLGGLILALLVAAPTTLLLTVAGGFWLATRAMRPVRAITRAANEISAGDLSRRLNLRRQDEIGELAATFDHMLGRLEDSFIRQRQFTGDASHELRTPLTIVDLEVKRALAQPRSTDEYARILSVVQMENDFAITVVRDLLTLARADTGQIRLRQEVLDLSDLTLDVAERLMPLACQKNIRLDTGTLPELPVIGDPLLLTQLLTNVIENAIIYTAGTGDHVHVETGAVPGTHTCWVRVCDNGPGIAAEHLPHVFDRFYRADYVRETGAGGSGLGLSIAQEIAQQHGGTIQVQSSPGTGATFDILLPLVAPPNQ